MPAFYAYVDALSKTPDSDGDGNTTYGDRGWKLDSTWTHPLYAPQGIMPEEDENLFLTLFSRWKEIPYGNPWKAFAPGGDSFVGADYGGVNLMLHEDETNLLRPTLLGMTYNQAGQCETEPLLKAYRDIEAALDKSPISDYVSIWGGFHGNWGSFDTLEAILMTSVLVDLACVLILSFIVLQSVFAALASLLGIAMIVVQTFGICCVIMSFNSYLCGSVLISVGIAVEFVAHMTAAFAHASGSTKARLSHGLCDIGPALLQGTLTTFAGVIPMAFHHLPASREYMFPSFSLLMVFGLYNGFVFVPGALAFSPSKGDNEAL